MNACLLKNFAFPVQCLAMKNKVILLSSLVKKNRKKKATADLLSTDS